MRQSERGFELATDPASTELLVDEEVTTA